MLPSLIQTLEKGPLSQFAAVCRCRLYIVHHKQISISGCNDASHLISVTGGDQDMYVVIARLLLDNENT